jgi:hypothetical protein
VKNHNNIEENTVGDNQGNRLFAGFVFLVVVFGLFNAFRFGVADASYALVRAPIDNWHTNANYQSKEVYEKANKAIEWASKLHGANPVYMNSTGYVNEWGVVSGFSPSLDIESAKHYYLKATKLRPLSSVAWANLAMLKWRTHEFDDEMLYYLHKANDLGPQAVEVHTMFTKLGIVLNKAKHPMFAEISDIVTDRVRLGLRNSRSKPLLLNIVKNEDALSTVCRWVELNDPITAQRHLNCG